METIQLDTIIQKSVLKRKSVSEHNLLQKTQLVLLMTNLQVNYPASFLCTIDPCITDEELALELSEMVEKGITTPQIIQQDPLWC